MTACHIGTFVAETTECNGRTFELVVDEADRTSAWQCLTCREYGEPADHECAVCEGCGSAECECGPQDDDWIAAAYASGATNGPLPRRIRLTANRCTGATDD